MSRYKQTNVTLLKTAVEKNVLLKFLKPPLWIDITITHQPDWKKPFTIESFFIYFLFN
jgi:hypothetical protein